MPGLRVQHGAWGFALPSRDPGTVDRCGPEGSGVREWSEGGETAAMEPPCLKLFVGQLLLELPQWETCDFSKEVTQ